MRPAARPFRCPDERPQVASAVACFGPFARAKARSRLVLALEDALRNSEDSLSFPLKRPSFAVRYRFAEFEFDPERGLTRDGAPVEMEPRAQDILRYLLDNPGRVVSRDELCDHLWDGLIVSDAAISTQIRSVRKALGDDREQQRFVRTHPRRGFSFVGEVSTDQLRPGADRILRPKRRWQLPVAVLAGVLVVIAGWLILGSKEAPLPTGALAELQARHGVAVLPFENLSPDPEQSYFAIGLTEELILRLSRFANIRVIARNSTSRFTGGGHDLRDVSSALGARYIVEGSVRRDTDRLRVSAKLIDGENGVQIWSASFDEVLSTKAIFEVQDAIASTVASNIGGLGGAIRKSAPIPALAPDDLDAYDCVHLQHKFWDDFDHAVHAKAQACLERAVERHPDFALGWAELAYTYWTEHAYGVNPKPGSLERARTAAETAIKLDPEMAEGYGALSQTYRSMKRADEAVAAAERAFSINPNNVGIIGGAGCMLTFTGRLERAEVFLDRATALDPFPPWWIPYCKAIWHLQRAEPNAALDVLGDLTGSDIWLVHFARAVALVDAGRLHEAQSVHARLIKDTPDVGAKVKSYVEKNFWATPDFADQITNSFSLSVSAAR